MSERCPCCNQIVPVKGQRACVRCQRPIKRHDRWHAVGSLIYHRDCNDRTLSNQKPPRQGQLIEVAP